MTLQIAFVSLKHALLVDVSLSCVHFTVRFHNVGLVAGKRPCSRLPEPSIPSQPIVSAADQILTTPYAAALPTSRALSRPAR
jgi:hypothetical protein